MNLLSKIFSKSSKKKYELFDLALIATDLHSHLIPGIDDGSRSLQESVDLIKELKNLGYKKLITTPHIQSDLYKNTPEIILGGLKQLKDELIVQGVDIEIEAAAEYIVDGGLMNLILEDKVLTFGNKNILIELSYISEPPHLNEILFDLQIRGYTVILAHPERYSYWHKNLPKYEDLFNRGVKFQLNINSLTGWYSEESKKMAEKLIEMKWISYLGSDLHNFNYLDELKKSRYSHFLHKAFETNKILNDTL